MEGDHTCPFCKGTGWKYMEGDLHRSSGYVPCNHKPKEKAIGN